MKKYYLAFLSLFVSKFLMANCTLNNKDVPCDVFWAKTWWIFGALGVIVLLTFILWLWAIVDVIRRPMENKPMWVIILLLSNLLGVIIYYFVVVKGKKATA